MSGDRPPRLALWLAGLRLRREEREFALGDLAEEFAERHALHGDAAARRWLRRQMLRCLLTPAPASPRVDATFRGGTMSGIWRDLGFAWRLMRRAPLVAAAAVLTFALGVGANAAIFSVAWPVLGARLPFPDEARLTFILLSVERNGRAGSNPISPGDYLDLLTAQSFDGLAGFNMFPSQRNLTSEGEPQQLRVGTVTEDFFGVLGVPPLAGRAIDARDFVGGARALVLHERVWRRTFSADPAVVGRTVRMDGQAWTVVGVMPAGATIGTIDVDAWSTQPVDRATARQQRSYYLAMIGRLKPDVTLEAANSELVSLMRRVADRYPVSNQLADGTPILARAESFRERLTGPVRPVFLLLIGGAALVLIIAGINLAALQVARNLARRHELGVRRALGAGRGVLVRQLMIESLTVSIAGGLAGLVAAALTLGALASLAPTVAWYEVSPQLTTPVVVFTVGLTFLAGLLVGLAPAVIATRATGEAGPLQARGGTAGRRTVRLRTGIVGVQVAMTVLLLIAATLSAASLARVLHVDPGFEIDSGLIADVRAPGDQGDGIRFFDELVTRAEALPGVARACAINHVPLDNDGGSMTFVAEGKTDADRQGALPMGVTAGCFDTLRIPLRHGRPFQRTETESVAIVNESMAKALWPDGADPVGKRLHIGLVSGPLFTVVGVVRDIRAAALESTFRRQVWMSAARGWPMPQRLILRTDVPPETLARPLRTLLGGMNPDLALANVRTMRDIVGEATASRRFVLVLLGGFAGIALALSAVGTYGMLSYQVGQRTREIGIRVALGARRADVTRTLVAHVALGVVAGVVVGAAGARLLASAIATQLYEMSATDARVYAGVTAFVVVVAALSCWSPLRRAGRVEPIAALRVE
jgi:predicted permease